MADAMTPDGILRACAFLGAVWREDGAAMAVLLRHEPGEQPTPVLVAGLGDLIMQAMLPARLGIHDGMPADELAAGVSAVTWRQRRSRTVRQLRPIADQWTQAA
ncbi:MULTISPECIES: hypothetical protein [unclassified Streptomyces]|uniref:hypothetical protein n=1 Tax=unclassified Streptomyces TaxID=2593676 RepID=UPI0033985D27